MTQVEFYNTYIKPFLKADDRPYNRQLFNDTKDSLSKSGSITKRQALKWNHPLNDYFYSRPELGLKEKKNFDGFVTPYIFDNINPSDYGLEKEPETEKDKLQFLFDTFKAEYLNDYNLRNYGNVQNVFSEWLKGLPTAFLVDFENYRIIELAKEWGLIPA